MIPVVVAAVVIFLIARQSARGNVWAPLGSQPLPGGADGSPAARAAALSARTTTVGNSEQNIAHGLESAIGGIAAAGVCTAFGAGAAAPLCGAIGAKVAPAVVALGAWTARQGVKVAEQGVNIAANTVSSTVHLGAQAFGNVANYADRGYSALGKLPPGVSQVAKIGVLPIKIAADVTGKIGHVADSAVGSLTSGTKSAVNAVGGAVNKVLGWL